MEFYAFELMMAFIHHLELQSPLASVGCRRPVRQGLPTELVLGCCRRVGVADGARIGLQPAREGYLANKYEAIF